MQQVISFDLDGVLANFTRGFTRIAHKLHGTPVGDGHSQETWNFEDYSPLNLTKEQCEFHHGAIWTEIKNDPNFWADLDPFNPSVMPLIDKIVNKIFITNRFGVDVRQQSIDFLEIWGVEDPNVVVATKKAPIAIAHNVVAHLDDYLPNCLELQAALPNAYVVLHKTPYNARLIGAEWTGPVAQSVDHFIDDCIFRGLVQW